MKNFSELGIAPPAHKALTGEKIAIKKVFNLEIEVHAYRLQDSKIKTGTKCLHLQIKYNGEMRVIFSGSTFLIDAVLKITEWPFKTTIVEEQNCHLFT